MKVLCLEGFIGSQAELDRGKGGTSCLSQGLCQPCQRAQARQDGNVPDIKWDLKEILRIKMPVSDKYVMIAEASGTPNGPFLGVGAPTGKGFCFLAIDVRYVVDGLIKETWHIEGLAAAITQLTNKDEPDGVPRLHNGQPSNFGMWKQNAPGMQIPPWKCRTACRDSIT